MIPIRTPRILFKARGLRLSCVVLLALIFPLQAMPIAQSRKTTTIATPKRQIRQYTLEQFLDPYRIFGSSFSHDEKSILFSSNETGIFNAYTVPITGGKPQQLTHSSKESTFANSYFPYDSRILYAYDKGGDENHHVYLLDADGKERDLTPGNNIRAQCFSWSHDLKSFYFSTNERDARFSDIYRMDVDGFKRTLIYQDTMGYDWGGASPDGKHIALIKTNTTSDSDLYLYTLATKEMKHITPHKGDVSYSPQTYDMNSRYLYYLTNDGSEFTYVARYELTTGKVETVEKAPWDIFFTFFSFNWKYRVVGINEDARTKIKVYEEATGKQIEMPKLPLGDIASVDFSRSERLMAFYFNASRSSNNLYVYDLVTKEVRKLTETMNTQIDLSDLIEAQVVRYKSFDGLEIPSILYKPHEASATNKLPAIVWVHGGPGGQTRIGYSGVIQFLANHGYVILGVNYRGSAGYGKSFVMADDRKHGREPLWDCVEAKKYLATLDYVDTSKIGILGMSYGGYVVLAALAFKPDEFNVGVDLFGVSNWVRTLESLPPYWESIRLALYKEMGDPKVDSGMLRDISPLFHADKIKKPLMVLQGANDPRVIKPESDEIVEAVKKNKGIVEYIVFPNEGHGFTKKANELSAYKGVLSFLDRYLRRSEAGK